MKLNNLRLPFSRQALGSQKDYDQYLYQCGFSHQTVADATVMIDGRNLSIYIVCQGEQKVFVNFATNDNEDENTRVLLPIGEAN